MKDLGEEPRDRSKKLFGLSEFMYIHNIVKRFDIENSKKGYILMRHGVQISKEHSPKTLEDIDGEDLTRIGDWIHHIHYAMYKTR